MPQMAPSNWLLIFLMVTIMLLMISSLNYFSFNYKLKNNNTVKKNKMNWKW